VSERILVGHFLTREDAADRVGIAPDELMQRPDLLRVGGMFLEEVYFAFQFDGPTIRHDLGSVVRMLRKRFDDETVADWLARPNATLASMTPLRWVKAGHDGHALAVAAVENGPICGDDEIVYATSGRARR
jgi:hypothetical protein